MRFMARLNAPTYPDADHNAPRMPTISAKPADGDSTSCWIGVRRVSTADADQGRRQSATPRRWCVALAEHTQQGDDHNERGKQRQHRVIGQRGSQIGALIGAEFTRGPPQYIQDDGLLRSVGDSGLDGSSGSGGPSGVGIDSATGLSWRSAPAAQQGVICEGGAQRRGRIRCPGTPEPTDDHPGQQAADCHEKSIQPGPPGR